MKKTLSACGLALALWLVASPPAFAQPDPGAGEDPGQERATSFRAVSGPDAEQVPGGPLLIGAYAVLWVLVLGFVVRMGVAQSRTQAEVERLCRVLDRAEDGGES